MKDNSGHNKNIFKNKNLKNENSFFNDVFLNVSIDETEFSDDCLFSNAPYYTNLEGYQHLQNYRKPKEVDAKYSNYDDFYSNDISLSDASLLVNFFSIK